MKFSVKRIRSLQQVGQWASNVTLMLTVAVFVPLGKPAEAQTFSIVHTFTTNTDDGATPQSGPTLDAKGNLYGTTSYGGKRGDGSLYKIDTTGKFSLLFSLSPPNADPGASPVQDAAGNIYGTTQFGGPKKLGTVWKVSHGGKGTTLWKFTGGKDGALPFFASLMLGSNSDLYGVTVGEGLLVGQCTPPLCGTLYKVNNKTPGKLTVLHVFGKDKKDGISPGQGLVQDPSGNFYGSTGCGGAYGLGTIFEFTKAGEYKVLYSFKGGKGSCAADSVGGPWGSGTLALDSQGNLYGTTWTDGKFGLGKVFELSASGQLTDLHDFTGKSDGANPWTGVLLDGKGNLYGTSQSIAGGPNQGTVFEIDRAGLFKLVYSFTGGSDGSGPVGLTIDKTGITLYGTTASGGDPSCQCGTVFKLAL